MNNLKTLMLVVSAMMSCGVTAREIQVEFEIPVFDTADYNKPYVAIWLELPKVNETLLLWHLKSAKDDKWLPDIRRWWRKLGRYGDPVDGVTGATRGPGGYHEVFNVDAEGSSTLLIEVVREDGGRSLLKQRVDLSGEAQQFILPADKEIGETKITLGEI